MIFWGKKSITSMIPIYSTTVLYDTGTGCSLYSVKIISIFQITKALLYTMQEILMILTN